MPTSEPSTLNAYRRHTAIRGLRLAILAIALSLAALVALAVGAYGLSPTESLRALFGGSNEARLVMRELRLPRVLMGILVGSGLAMGGTVCQAVLVNPLASPFTLGVASGAALGAVCAIVADASITTTAAAAFGAAVLTTMVNIGIARLRGATPQTLILTGVALMFLCSATTSLLQYVVRTEQVHAIVFWTFGSLSKAGWKEIVLAAPMVGLPGLWLCWHAWDLNLLGAGEDVARSVGVDTRRVRNQSLLLCSLMCAGAICFTGVIGFIGLVAPHIGRMLLGNDHRFLLPASALIGGCLVMLADTLGRTLWVPQVIPVGIVTSLLGVPFFLYLLLRSSRSA